MSLISGVSYSNNVYAQLSSGKRINSAADDASGLAIANKLEKEERGLNAGTENAKDGISLANVADGALDQINDSLQRIYELSVSASSGIKTDSDKAAIQNEVSQLLDGIQSVAKGTEFNTMKILDGSMADVALATKPDGSGQSIQMYNSTLESLGIDGYDVTGDFDINRITDAIAKVSDARSGIGAMTNGLESTIHYNNITAENTLSAKSSLEDLDMPKAISEMKKQQTLNQYQMMMQKKQQDDEQFGVLSLFRF